MTEPQDISDALAVSVPAASERDAPAALAPVAVRPLPSARLRVEQPPAPGELARRAGALQSTALRGLQHAHYQLSRIGIAGQAGLLALVAAGVIALSVLVPARHSLQTLSQELLRSQATVHGGAAGAPSTVAHFMGTLPTRGQVPAVLGIVYQQAKEAGVALDSGRYAFSAGKSGSVARYEVEFPVKGTYPSIRTFIDRTLSAVPAAGLDRLRVERKSVGDALVNADVRFVLFVRPE
ncbi:MAG: hypothetical protein JOZ67_10155 [Gammaproteobacteria bacterium]|nr:hypothetical protein [Gammaproteobacteria bacterium]MBV9697504.1 hypothetical protein [Gammaproteobacteria bacterium]